MSIVTAAAARIAQTFGCRSSCQLCCCATAFGATMLAQARHCLVAMLTVQQFVQAVEAFSVGECATAVLCWVAS
jgi:hypothetical protein